MGPYMTTKDEIPDINNVRLWLKVNGKTYQDGNTANLIFSVQQVVSYVSQFMTLLDRKSTRLNSSHVKISYAVFCLKKKTKPGRAPDWRPCVHTASRRS